jgi:hypothetical protein
VDAFAAPDHAPESTLALVGSGVELTLGLALMLRLWPAVSAPAAGLLFALLAGVSLIGTTRGAASCRCLGALAAPPWILLIFDVGAAAFLLGRLRTSAPIRGTQAWVFVAAGVGFLFVGLAIGSIAYPRSGAATPATSAKAIAAARTVIIEPARLEGRPFFLLQFIRIDADLSRGEWKVIMARPGCRKCDRRLKSGECKPDGQERVAVVLADENEGWNLPGECEAVVGRLSKEKTWLFEAPLIVRLRGGRVSAAR